MDDSTNVLHENADVISQENKEQECKIGSDLEKPDSPAEPEYIVVEPVCDVLDVAEALEMPRAILAKELYAEAYQSDLKDEEYKQPDNPNTVRSISPLRDLEKPDSPAEEQDRAKVLDVAEALQRQRPIFVEELYRDAYQGDLIDEGNCLNMEDVYRTMRADYDASTLNNAQSMESLVEEDTPLIKKEEIITASRPDQILEDSIFGTSPESRSISPPKKIIYSEDRSKLKLIHRAEDVLHRSSTSGDKVDGKALRRCRNIATAIYLDDEQSLKIFISNGPPWSKSEIQRRLLEVVELNSLKCLDVLCKKYEKEKFSMEKDVILFHRRYGLSFWPLDERAKETALHVLASKLTSTNAMDVLKNRPKFLTDFSDVPDSHGSTPLLLAIKCNNIEVIKGLLPAKPDINKRNRHKESPFHVAALNDHDDIIREILKTYSESQERTKLLEIMKNIDGKGHSILYSASQSGKPKVLNLIMEHDWWEDCLEQEKKCEDLTSFVCNVCAAGCKGLAKIILQEDSDLLLKRKKDVTPLMRAAEANQEEIVRLIFDIKPDHDLVATCDKDGRNVFHYAVKNPKVLKYLLSQFVKCKDKEAINKMDNFENTPIKLAAVGNLKESFELLSKYTTSEEDMFSAHLIHSVDIKVLMMGLCNWKIKDPEAVACLLRGDHKEHQPFLEAAKKGNIELMEFFLQEGANHLQRTPNDQTAIHYAVLSGKLEAVKQLLNKKEFLEMIDFTDEVNITAAGYATQTGFAEILRCLLENNAQMLGDKKTARLNILDSAYGFFKTGENSIKEIVKFCTKDKNIEMLRELFEDSHFGADCIMSKLIEETPNVAMLIFNLCVYEDKYFTHRSYGETEVGRRVLYSFFPFIRKYPKGKSDGKLEAIESMVNFKRDDCLGHPLVIRFLSEKMNSSSIQLWFILNILLYTTFLVTLTTYGAIQSQGLYNLISPGMIALSVIILIISAFHFIKEVLQMVFNKIDYLIDFENYIEWVMYIGAVIYVVPGGRTKANIQIAAGAFSIFLGWINFSLFLKRFSLFGIYIIMTKRVFLTVCKVLPLVVLFIAAFSFSLSVLMPLDQGFNNIPISLLTTFVMMTGDLDYRGTFLASGPFHVLQKILLVLFILMVSIAIMNLLTGLAVGDTNEIMNRSKEKERIYKATLVITLERNLHNFPFISPPKIKNNNIQDPPDEMLQCSSSWLSRQWQKVYDDDELEERLKAMRNDDDGDYGKQFDELREEIKKTNENTAAMENRLKNIEAMLAQIQPGNIPSSN